MPEEPVQTAGLFIGTPEQLAASRQSSPGPSPDALMGAMNGPTASAPELGPQDVEAMRAKQAAERESNPNIRPWTGPAESDGCEFAQPAAPNQNAALVEAIRARQAQAPAAAPALPAPQTVTANPVPQQDPMAGLDPRTSPGMRAYMASGEFDGMGFNNAQSSEVQQMGRALPASSIPDAPTGVERVAGAIQQAAKARGVDPRALVGIMNSSAATPAAVRWAATPRLTVLSSAPGPLVGFRQMGLEHL